MADPATWGDLKVRIASGIVMAGIGLGAVFLGGVWFDVLVVFLSAAMIWELACMIAPERPLAAMLLAVLAAASFSGDLRGWSLALFALAPVLGTFTMPRKRLLFLGFSLYILAGGWGLISFRADHGLVWFLWLLAVVIVTDIAGYFAGRILGGPKFWPAVSPRKTWSGTAAGWLGAAVVGLGFALSTRAGAGVVALSVAVSFASQIGDILESALKRHVGVKDSSALIPGHGGVFDRFDAVLGATVFMLVLTFALNLPGPQF